MLGVGLGVSGASGFSDKSNRKNKIPRWKGFNLTDFFTPNPSPDRRYTTEEHIKWIRDWAFDFIPLPIEPASQFYLPHFPQIDKYPREKFFYCGQILCNKGKQLAVV